MEDFIVGRYETGGLSPSNQVCIVKGNNDKASQNWYTKYNKCKELKNNNINVETNMIWGCQFDRVLKFLIETGNKSLEEISVDSSSWGNYKSSSFEYETENGVIKIKNSGVDSIIPTGSTEYTKANNIYDLSGNMMEATMECFSKEYHTNRGNFMDSPVSKRAMITGAITNYGNCRAILYIKI